MSLYKIFGGKEIEYNTKLVNNYILIIKTTKEEKKKNDFTLKLFLMMKTVVTKNVNNYLSLINNANVKQILEVEEIETEAFIIFINCVKKFKVNGINNFYFYFNKSLSRNFFRLHQKEVKKNTSRLTEATSFYINEMKTEMDLDVSLVVESLNLDKVENLVYPYKADIGKKYKVKRIPAKIGDVVEIEVEGECLIAKFLKITETGRAFLVASDDNFYFCDKENLFVYLHTATDKTERRVLMSKIRNISKEIFIKNTNISTSNYYNAIKAIKEKASNLKVNNDVRIKRNPAKIRDIVEIVVEEKLIKACYEKNIKNNKALLFGENEKFYIRDSNKLFILDSLMSEEKKISFITKINKTK